MTSARCAAVRTVGYSSRVTPLRSREPRVEPLSESANRQQAEHLREMLLAQCDELDADLVTYGSALERYQRRGEQTQARRIRGMIRTAERERRAVQDLIANLEQRFLETGPTRPQPAPNPARHPVNRVHPHPSPHRVIRTGR